VKPFKSRFSRYRVGAQVQLYMFLVPGLLLLGAFFYLPMLGILLAFKDYRYNGNIIESFMSSEWVGFRYFERFFATEQAWVAIRNTLLYNGAFIILGLVLAVGLAITLNELRRRSAIKLYQTAFILPFFLSWTIVAYFIYALLNTDNGIINNYLRIPFGLAPINYYFTPGEWPRILILTGLWKNVGFNSVVYFAAISSIDQQMYEAAMMDGASKWKQARHITIPTIVPIMVVLTILAIGRVFFADFGLFYNVPLNVGAIRDATEVVDTYVYKMMRTGDFSFATAAGLVQGFLGFVLVLTTNRVVKKVSPENRIF